MSGFRRHFIYKLATNFLRIPVSFVLQAIFPRLLGPAAYGNYDFLVDNSNKIIGFFENGVSTAFYTKLSHKPDDTRLVRFFAWIVFFISALYFTLIFSSFFGDFYSFIWPNQEYPNILLSAVLGVVTFASNGVHKMIDAYELTVKGEWNRMIQLVISVLVFYGAYQVFETLNLNYFFYIQIALTGMLIVGSAIVLRSNYHRIIPKEKLSRDDIRSYTHSFWHFSHPLIVYSFMGLFVGIGERWLLQLFGGSIQQGFFGLSYKVGAFVFLFTSAVMPLLTREFAKLFGDRNIDGLRNLYFKNLKILYVLAVFMAVFSALNADFIISMLAGKGYEGAGMLVALMAFYPIHQTLGQLNGTLFYATNRTREYRNIGIIFMPLSLVLCYFFIAPIEYFGLGLGAQGLVYEMLIIQVFVINIQLINNMKFFNSNYWELLWFQLLIVGSFLGIGLLEKRLIGIFVEDLFMTGVIFFMLFAISISIIILLMPKLIGLNNKSELYSLILRRG